MDNHENLNTEDLNQESEIAGKCGSHRPCQGKAACGAARSCSDRHEADAYEVSAHQVSAHDAAVHEACAHDADMHEDDYYEEDDSEPLSRADFMRLAFGGTIVLWGGVALAPIVAYLTPPPGEDQEASKITSVEVCKLSDLPKGTGRNFRFGSFPAVVVHDQEGNLHAFKAICTHLGCTVQFRADKQCIYCACHGGVYDASTGKNTAGPPPKPLPPLKVAVVEDKVVVSKA